MDFQEDSYNMSYNIQSDENSIKNATYEVSDHNFSGFSASRLGFIPGIFNDHSSYSLHFPTSLTQSGAVLESVHERYDHDKIIDHNIDRSSSHGPFISKDDICGNSDITEKSLAYYPSYMEAMLAKKSEIPGFSGVNIQKVRRSLDVKGSDIKGLIDSKIATTHSPTSAVLVKSEEIPVLPVKYFVNKYHSGLTEYKGGNRNINFFKYKTLKGIEDSIEPNKLDRSKYPISYQSEYVLYRTELCDDLETLPLRQYCFIYHKRPWFHTKISTKLEKEKENDKIKGKMKASIHVKSDQHTSEVPDLVAQTMQPNITKSQKMDQLSAVPYIDSVLPNQKSPSKGNNELYKLANSYYDHKVPHISSVDLTKKQIKSDSTPYTKHRVERTAGEILDGFSKTDDLVYRPVKEQPIQSYFKTTSGESSGDFVREDIRDKWNLYDYEEDTFFENKIFAKAHVDSDVKKDEIFMKDMPIICSTVTDASFSKISPMIKEKPVDEIFDHDHFIKTGKSDEIISYKNSEDLSRIKPITMNDMESPNCLSLTDDLDYAPFVKSFKDEVDKQQIRQSDCEFIERKKVKALLYLRKKDKSETIEVEESPISEYKNIMSISRKPKTEINDEKIFLYDDSKVTKSNGEDSEEKLQKSEHEDINANRRLKEEFLAKNKRKKPKKKGLGKIIVRKDGLKQQSLSVNSTVSFLYDTECKPNENIYSTSPLLYEGSIDTLKTVDELTSYPFQSVSQAKHQFEYHDNLSSDSGQQLFKKHTDSIKITNLYRTNDFIPEPINLMVAHNNKGQGVYVKSTVQTSSNISQYYSPDQTSQLPGEAKKVKAVITLKNEKTGEGGSGLWDIYNNPPILTNSYESVSGIKPEVDFATKPIHEYVSVDENKEWDVHVKSTVEASPVSQISSQLPEDAKKIKAVITLTPNYFENGKTSDDKSDLRVAYGCHPVLTGSYDAIRGMKPEMRLTGEPLQREYVSDSAYESGVTQYDEESSSTNIEKIKALLVVKGDYDTDIAVANNDEHQRYNRSLLEKGKKYEIIDSSERMNDSDDLVITADHSFQPFSSVLNKEEISDVKQTGKVDFDNKPFDKQSICIDSIDFIQPNKELNFEPIYKHVAQEIVGKKADEEFIMDAKKMKILLILKSDTLRSSDTNGSLSVERQKYSSGDDISQIALDRRAVEKGIYRPIEDVHCTDLLRTEEFTSCPVNSIGDKTRNSDYKGPKNWESKDYPVLSVNCKDQLYSGPEKELDLQPDLVHVPLSPHLYCIAREATKDSEKDSLIRVKEKADKMKALLILRENVALQSNELHSSFEELKEPIIDSVPKIRTRTTMKYPLSAVPYNGPLNILKPEMEITSDKIHKHVFSLPSGSKISQRETDEFVDTKGKAKALIILKNDVMNEMNKDKIVKIKKKHQISQLKKPQNLFRQYEKKLDVAEAEIIGYSTDDFVETSEMPLQSFNLIDKKPTDNEADGNLKLIFLSDKEPAAPANLERYLGSVNEMEKISFDLGSQYPDTFQNKLLNVEDIHPLMKNKQMKAAIILKENTIVKSDEIHDLLIEYNEKRNSKHHPVLNKFYKGPLEVLNVTSELSTNPIQQYVVNFIPGEAKWNDRKTSDKASKREKKLKALLTLKKDWKPSSIKAKKLKHFAREQVEIPGKCMEKETGLGNIISYLDLSRSDEFSFVPINLVLTTKERSYKKPAYFTVKSGYKREAYPAFSVSEEPAEQVNEQPSCHTDKITPHYVFQVEKQITSKSDDSHLMSDKAKFKALLIMKQDKRDLAADKYFERSSKKLWRFAWFRKSRDWPQERIIVSPLSKIGNNACFDLTKTVEFPFVQVNLVLNEKRLTGAGKEKKFASKSARNVGNYPASTLFKGSFFNTEPNKELGFYPLEKNIYYASKEENSTVGHINLEKYPIAENISKAKALLILKESEKLVPYSEDDTMKPEARFHGISADFCNRPSKLMERKTELSSPHSINECTVNYVSENAHKKAQIDDKLESRTKKVKALLVLKEEIMERDSDNEKRNLLFKPQEEGRDKSYTPSNVNEEAVRSYSYDLSRFTEISFLPLSSVLIQKETQPTVITSSVAENADVLQWKKKFGYHQRTMDWTAPRDTSGYEPTPTASTQMHITLQSSMNTREKKNALIILKENEELKRHSTGNAGSEGDLRNDLIKSYPTFGKPYKGSVELIAPKEEVPICPIRDHIFNFIPEYVKAMNGEGSQIPMNEKWKLRALLKKNKPPVSNVEKVASEKAFWLHPWEDRLSRQIPSNKQSKKQEREFFTYTDNLIKTNEFFAIPLKCTENEDPMHNKMEFSSEPYSLFRTEKNKQRMKNIDYADDQENVAQGGCGLKMKENEVKKMKALLVLKETKKVKLDQDIKSQAKHAFLRFPSQKHGFEMECFPSTSDALHDKLSISKSGKELIPTSIHKYTPLKANDLVTTDQSIQLLETPLESAFHFKRNKEDLDGSRLIKDIESSPDGAQKDYFLRKGDKFRNEDFNIDYLLSYGEFAGITLEKNEVKKSKIKLKGRDGRDGRDNRDATDKDSLKGSGTLIDAAVANRDENPYDSNLLYRNNEFADVSLFQKIRPAVDTNISDMGKPSTWGTSEFYQSFPTTSTNIFKDEKEKNNFDKSPIFQHRLIEKQRKGGWLIYTYNVGRSKVSKSGQNILQILQKKNLSNDAQTKNTDLTSSNVEIVSGIGAQQYISTVNVAHLKQVEFLLECMYIHCIHYIVFVHSNFILLHNF